MSRGASPLPSTVDVIIVGGGVIGCAAARGLASDHDVVLFERGQLAGGASALAAGEITMTPSYTDHPVVADHANDFFRDYDGTGDFRYEERPSIELVSPDRVEVAQRRVDRLSDAELDIELLEASSVESRFPRVDLGDDFAAAVQFADTGFVDPYTFTMTLAHDAEARGAMLCTETPVTDLVIEGDSVVGVETDAGRLCSPHVVVAAGWRTPEFLDGITAVPVRPYRTQCVVLDTGDDLDESFPMGWVPGEHVYFRPERTGDLLVGGWSFATDDPVGASRQADETFTQHVAALLPTFLRDVDHARVLDGWAGVDGATPDTRPIIDAPEDAPAGLVVATGFHGRGIMTAPVAATLVRSHVTDEPTTLPRGEFAIDRFDDRSRDFPFFSISAGDDDYET